LEPLEDRRMLASVPAAYLISVIGPQNGVSSSIPLAINNNSQVVGVTDTPTITGQAEQAFLYSGGAMQNLGSLPSGNTSLADAISDSGEIAADSFSLNGASTGFVVNGGALQSIGALTQSAGATSQANGVNSSGQVVGYSTSAATLATCTRFCTATGSCRTSARSRVDWTARP
jgi:probable HAF family extracellular repeat protein